VDDDNEQAKATRNENMKNADTATPSLHENDEKVLEEKNVDAGMRHLVENPLAVFDNSNNSTLDPIDVFEKELDHTNEEIEEIEKSGVTEKIDTHINRPLKRKGEITDPNIDCPPKRKPEKVIVERVTRSRVYDIL
jgi:hypothetical protein